MVEDAISFWTDIQRFEDMLVADPYSECFVPLSELYRKLGLLDDAISVALKGSDLHPDYPAGFFALGAAVNAKGLTDEARRALERTVSLDPGHLQAHRLLAQLCADSGDLACAEEELKQVLQQNPDDLECSLLLDSVSSRRGAHPEEELLEEAELIEDLTEVLEEPAQPQAPARGGAEGIPGAGSGTQPLRPEAAPSAGKRFDPFADSDDLWAIEAPGECAEPETWSLPAAVCAVVETEEFEAFDLPDLSDTSPILSTPGTPPASPEPEIPEVPPLFEEFEASDAFESFKEPVPLQQQVRDPLTTATLAELYVTQGFIGKALGIYRELLAADPGNQSYRLRCTELQELQLLQQQGQQPAAPLRPEAAPPAAQPPVRAEAPAAAAALPPLDAETELNRWLENIRRRRDGV